MKYTIHGFSQKGLLDLGLDTIDAMILRYFVDFKATNKMRVATIEDNLFFWVNYDNVVKELPILRMKRRSIQARFFKLREAGVLTHHLKKEGGTYSFFGIGSRYEELLSWEKLEAEGEVQQRDELYGKGCGEWQGQGSEQEKVEVCVGDEQQEERGCEGSTFNEQGSSLAEEGSNIYEQGCQFKLLPKNPSTKDSSTINNIPSSKRRCGEGIKSRCGEANKNTIEEIIAYLNEATGKKFKSETKATGRLIKARLGEGFQVEDFKRVIDNMVFNWTGTRFQQYLAPGTLFSSKFETYLQGGKGIKDGYRNGEYGRSEEGQGLVQGLGQGRQGFRKGTGGERPVLKQGNVARAVLKEGNASTTGVEHLEEKAGVQSAMGEKCEELAFIFEEDM